jgi:hypothetical protein
VQIVRLPIAAAVLVLALGGCGADSGGSGKTPLSTDEWQREANAICRQVSRELRRIPPPQAESEISAFVAATTPLWRRQENQIAALEPPDELAVPVRDYLQALSYLEAALVEIHISTQRNDGQRRYDATNKAGAASADMRQRSGELGLPACAQQRFR